MTDIHTEADAIIKSQTETVGQMLNDLRNYFYAATGPIERHEYARDVVQDAIMGPIRVNLDFARSASMFAELMMANFKKAGVAGKVETIRAVAIDTIASVVAERVQNGKVCGNAHHIRQEVSAKAMIAVAKTLDLAA